MIQPSVSESRDIDAPAARSSLCPILTHPAVDGTRLRSAADNGHLTTVGDVFNIEMVHWHLGNYVMANHVVEFEQDRLIGWEPASSTRTKTLKYQQLLVIPVSAKWGWHLEPLSHERTG